MKKIDKRKTKRSESQVKERKRFAMLNKEWGSLSYEQKLGWYKLSQKEKVKTSGKSKELMDGQLLFLSYNGLLQEAEEPINKEAPVIKEPQNYLNSIVEITNNDEESEMLLFFKQAIEADTKVILYATGELNIGSPKIDERNLRKIGVIDSEFLSGSSILARYLHVFKTVPPKGKVIGFKALHINKRCGKPGVNYPHPFIVK